MKKKLQKEREINKHLIELQRDLDITNILEEEDNRSQDDNLTSVSGSTKVHNWIKNQNNTIRYDRHNLKPCVETQVDNVLHPRQQTQVDNVLHPRQQTEVDNANNNYRRQSKYGANHYFDTETNQNENLIGKFIARQAVNRDLPIFSGEPLKWPQFIAEFENSTRKCQFLDSENIDRLRKCLRGKAKDVVDHLMILPESLNEILKILRNRFGRSDFIVHHLLDKLSNFPVVKEGKPELLVDFNDFLISLVSTLKILNEDDHLRNPVLFRDILLKIPSTQAMQFIEYFDRLNKDPPKIKILEFMSWIGEKASAASQLTIPSKQIEPDKPSAKGALKKDMTYIIVNDSAQKTCQFCKTTVHRLNDCVKFQKTDVNLKWDFITKNQHCFSCLNPGHMLKFCKQRKSCGINNCSRPHHHLLHKPKVNDTPADSNFLINNTARKVLLKIVPVKLKGPKMTIETFALLDDASTVSLIDEAIANELGLDGPIQTLKIQWTNGQVKQQNDSKTVSVSISGNYDQAKPYILRHVKTMKGLSLPTQSIDFDKIFKYFKYSPNITNVSFINGKPLILIGQDNWPVIINRKIIYGPWNGPAISKTLLGWVAHGSIGELDDNPNYTCHVFQTEKYQTDRDDINVLHELVKEQWKFESCGTKAETEVALSLDDKRCAKIMQNTIRRIDGDRFECGFYGKTTTRYFQKVKPLLFPAYNV